MKKPHVVVAMSGGVDSSVAAALLVEQGYQVTGMMLRLWSEEGREDSNRCCTPDAMAQARRVAAQLGIPFYAIDAQAPFHRLVVGAFLDGYRSGVTPNPCTVCNRHIRWGFLLERARAFGADYLATGHYARIRRSGEQVELLRGVDRRKDQSYVMSVLSQEQLQQTLFPLGELTKPEVREIARKHKLAAAERAESQDLCFLAGEDYRTFLSRHALDVARPGKIVNSAGEVIGEHQGLAFYTIGQRKGLGIAAPQPLYVIEKRMAENELLVGPGEELGCVQMRIGPVNWIDGRCPDGPVQAEVKIRYTAPLVPAEVTPSSDGTARIVFEQPLRDITPGQLAALYQGEKVLGSGMILS